MHIGEIEFLLSLRFENLLILRAVVVGETLLLAPFAVFVGRHHYWCVDVSAANLVAYDIPVNGVVIFHRLLQVLRPFQVVGTLAEVVEGYRRRSLYGPPRMQQRVGNLLLVDNHLRHLVLHRVGFHPILNHRSWALACPCGRRGCVTAVTGCTRLSR